MFDLIKKSKKIVKSINKDVLLSFFYSTIISFFIVNLYGLKGVLMILFFSFLKQIIESAMIDSNDVQKPLLNVFLDMIFITIPSILIYMSKIIP